MDPVAITLTLGAALLIGGLIGSVGVGGVLLVPFLTAVIGLSVRESISIAMASYIVTGIVALLQSRATGNWGQLRPFTALVVATLPGALLGGFAVALIPERIALLILAAFLVSTGIWSLLGRRSATGVDAPAPRWPTGLVAGFASALTGTGGPAVLLPILIWRGIAMLPAIVVGQIVQLPIALAATAGNLSSGPFNGWIAVLVASGMVPGVIVGRWGASRLPVRVLSQIVAALLAATGLLMTVRALA